MKRINILMGAALACFVTSCKTPKEITYFQDITAAQEVLSEKLVENEFKLEPDDRLSISITALDPTTVAPFNLPLVNFSSPTDQTINTTPSLQTYLIDADGYIKLPVIGKVMAKGLTQGELADTLTQRIEQFVDNPVVIVNIAGSRVTMLGEVNRPGNVYFSDNQYSIIDGLGAVGDLTLYGQRENILLIREENGQRVSHHIDLTSKDLFNSPYFYLKQHDVVYVAPNEAKKKNSSYSQASQYNISLTSTLVSVASVIVSLVIAFSR